MRSSLVPVWRVLQYPVGLGVAALSSIVATLILMFVPVPLLMVHVVVGFLGVFIGSLFFMPASRVVGSIFLAAVGTGFYYVCFVWYNMGSVSIPHDWVRLAFIAVGAIIAVVTHGFWRFLCHGSA